MNLNNVLMTGGMVAVMAVCLSSCDKGATAAKAGATVPASVMADAIHTVLEADRTVYAKHVVTRLANNEKVIKASEHWKDDVALPLPAQMFRMGAELVQSTGGDVSYSLISQWPINRKNAPATDAEKQGVKYINEHQGERFYTEETLGDQHYFTAVYPDVAVAKACVACHNGHKDSPRSDFKIGDIMGGIVVRIRL